MAKTQGPIQDVCNKLSDEFQRVVPLHPPKAKPGKRLSESEIKVGSEAALRKFYDIAREETLRYRFGVIGRARVAFGLQQRLLAAGYAPALVKQVLFAMLTSAFVGSKS